MVSPYLEREAKRLGIGNKPTEINDLGIYIPEPEAEIIPFVIRVQNAMPYIAAALLMIALISEWWNKAVP